jgi:NAD(P)-dependent dehydrogenase (short-subunit alcohol dehydrogenase family)
MRLRDRIAIVTGGAQGIGEGIAEELAREGAGVVVADIQEDAAEEVARRIGAEGGRAISARCDVARDEDVRAVVERATSELGGLHVFVNNAAVGIYTHVLETTVEDFDRALAVNLRGVFLGTRHSAPAIAESGGGSIVNIASVHSVQNVGGTAPYAASKGGVAALTRASAVDLAPEVRVNAICPGWVDTPLIRGIFEGAPDPQAARTAVERRQLLGRLASPREVGRAAVFLASDDSSYVTGSLLFVDSGMTAQLETWSE